MCIVFDNKSKTFYLNTKNSSYVFCVSDFDTLEHLYYGKKIPLEDIRYISNRQIYSFQSHEDRESRLFSTATVGLEIATFNSGDFRTPSVVYDYENKVNACRLRYISHEIFKGRKAVEGMPYSRINNECESLEVLLADDDRHLEVTLSYTVYPEEDVIARHQTIKNVGGGALKISKFASFNLDFQGCDYDLLTLEGMYLSEKSNVVRTPIRKGVIKNNSIVGISSHHKNPFMVLCDKNASEQLGNAYGFNLLYSGNFSEEVEVDRLGNTRVMGGIDDTSFNWDLKAGEVFYSPEAVLTYSNEGIGGVSRKFHDHIRNNIIEKEFVYAKRPVVVNSWETFYFELEEEKLLKLAEEAKKCGADTLVVDDGWFRNGITEGLGDFKVDKNKFPSGIKAFTDKVHAMGIKMGIWIEPEMVSPNSDFYKEKPNCILSNAKTPLISRKQYVVDLTSDENIDIIVNRLKEEFAGVELDYLKWDFNRYITEASSNSYSAGEVYHRQTLGVYKLFERLKELFKGVLFETCSGGGGRFDLGMLYYSPQIWTSDNTDPYERLYIQYGTSYGYPPSTLSCHFTKGKCTSGRPSSYEFRYNVACFGPYGYELNVGEYSDEEKALFNSYSNKYREDEDLTLKGDLYRLISPESNTFCSYIKVSKDKNHAQFSFFVINSRGLTETLTIKLMGLDPNKLYKNSVTGIVLSGETLMNVGMRMDHLFSKKRSDGYLVNFVAVDLK